MESVCGVIEVKRTLTKKSIKKAIDHLLRSKEVLDNYKEGLKSKVREEKMISPNGVSAYLAPLYGIVSLEINRRSLPKNHLEEILDNQIKNFIDIVWSMSDGFLTIPIMKNVNKDDTKYVSDLTRISHATTEYEYFSSGFNDKNHKEDIFRTGLFFIRNYVQMTTGKQIEFKDQAEYLGFTK
ncbi:hypothetical protein GCM10009117_22210 [Gangjinia marincola]|uniref:Uncharacterized protein n=1 Tax=Gangjinia marincola TaxID=578463 RepID=A0ABN1MIP1_9FLAO